MASLLAKYGQIIGGVPQDGYVKYEKFANGTTLDELKAALSGMSKAECLATSLRITANDNNGGMVILYPTDYRDSVEVYRGMVAPYNATYSAMLWQIAYNRSNDNISYTQVIQAVNGTPTSSNPTVSSWELYREKTFVSGKKTGDETSYVINCPTTGYTSVSKNIWGTGAKTYQSITITTDVNGNQLSNFYAGMKEDIPINLTGTQADFGKLFAYEVGDGQVTFYFTSAPSSAFNVLIREAV